MASLPWRGRPVLRWAIRSAQWARYPAGVALRWTSRDTVETERPSLAAIEVSASRLARPREISSRSASDSRSGGHGPFAGVGRRPTPSATSALRFSRPPWPGPPPAASPPTLSPSRTGRGRVLVAEGEHLEGRIRRDEEDDPQESEGRGDRHDGFAVPPEEDVQGEEDRDQKHVVGNQQQIQVEQPDQPGVLEQREPVDRGPFERWGPDDEHEALDRDEQGRGQGSRSPDPVEDPSTGRLRARRHEPNSSRYPPA